MHGHARMADSIKKSQAIRKLMYSSPVNTGEHHIPVEAGPMHDHCVIILFNPGHPLLPALVNITVMADTLRLLFQPDDRY